ncbi:flap endonuclease-1 [Candidatus Woesearchaeota archaeon]|nr:flap endonuclease-1 [Candidatus Woesearchaeota archaeon]
MGVKIVELLKPTQISIDDLSGKTIAVDAPNHLYQFLTTIRSIDGTPFTDSNGNITSHLIGLFTRATSLITKNIKLVYVFDGKTPELKHKELQKRQQAKQEAQRKYEAALQEGNTEDTKKYAGRFARLTQEMTLQSKELLDGLGIPYVDAAGEAEAQAAHMAMKGEAYAVSSQDADTLLFGAPRLVRNLSITGKRKKTGRLGAVTVSPEIISLAHTLESLGITQEQLIAMGMLIGTDYNPGGIKGIGAKKALEIVKSTKDINRVFAHAGWENHFTEKWQEIYELFSKPALNTDYQISWRPVDSEKTVSLLCGQHSFSEERVRKTLHAINPYPTQKGLQDYI